MPLTFTPEQEELGAVVRKFLATHSDEAQVRALGIDVVVDKQVVEPEVLPDERVLDLADVHGEQRGVLLHHAEEGADTARLRDRDDPERSVHLLLLLRRLAGRRPR